MKLKRVFGLIGVALALAGVSCDNKSVPGKVGDGENKKKTADPAEPEKKSDPTDGGKSEEKSKLPVVGKTKTPPTDVNVGTGEPVRKPSNDTTLIPDPRKQPDKDAKPPVATSEENGEAKPLSPVEALRARGKLKAAQMKELQKLIGIAKTLRVWSLDEDGAFPEDLADEDFVDIIGAENVEKNFGFKNAENGEKGRPLYMRGTSAETQANFVLVASPWVYNGKRAVVFCDASGKVLDEAEYQKALKRTLAADGMELVK